MLPLVAGLCLSFPIQQPMAPGPVAVPLPFENKTGYEKMLFNIQITGPRFTGPLFAGPLLKVDLILPAKGDNRTSKDEETAPPVGEPAVVKPSLLPFPITAGPQIAGLPGLDIAPNAGDGATASGKATYSVAARHVFDEPATFERPAFGMRGNPMPTEGVLIYEGMEILVQRDGTYEVAYTALIPDQPVTIRLQLILRSCTGILPLKAACDGYLGGITLTLPPVRLEQRRTDDLGLLAVTDPNPGPPNIFRITQKGYSHRLKELLESQEIQLNMPGTCPRQGNAVPLGDLGFKVVRTGSTRFERIPQSLFDNYGVDR